MSKSIFETSLINEARSNLEHKINELSDFDIKLFSKSVLDSKVDVRNVVIDTKNDNSFLDLKLQGNYSLIQAWSDVYDVTHDNSGDNTLQIQDLAFHDTFDKICSYFSSRISCDSDQIIQQVLGEHSNLRRYLISRIDLEKSGCSELMIELLGLLYSISLIENEESMLEKFYNIPHYGEGEDLNCLRGTINRVVNCNISINCGDILEKFYEAMQSVIVSGYVVANPETGEKEYVESYTQRISKYAHEDYHVHIPYFLHYVLGVDSKNTRDIIAEYEIKNLDLIDCSLNYSKRMREALINSFRNNNDYGFINRFVFEVERERKNKKKETINLNAKFLLLDDESFEELLASLKSPNKTGDFTIAVDFVVSSFLGSISKTQKNFLQIYELITKYFDREFDLSYDQVVFNINSFVQDIKVIFNGKGDAFTLEYNKKLDDFKYKITQEYYSDRRTRPSFLKSFLHNNRNEIALGNINVISLINYGIGSKNLEAVLNNRNIFNDLFDLWERSQDSFVRNAISTIALRRDYLSISRELVNSFNRSDKSQPKRDFFDAFITNLIDEFLGSGRHDNPERIIYSLLEGIDNQSRVAIITEWLFRSIDDKNIDAFSTAYHFYSQNNIRDIDILPKILLHDFSEALEKIFGDNVINAIQDGRSLLYWALSNEKMEIVHFIIKKYIETGRRLEYFFQDNNGYFGDILGKEKIYSKLVEELYKNGFKLEDINNIGGRYNEKLLIVAAKNDNYELIEKVLNISISEIQSSLQNTSDQNKIRSIGVITQGIKYPKYEERLTIFLDHYKKNKAIVPNINSFCSSLFYEVVLSTLDNKENKRYIDTVIKLLRLSFLTNNSVVRDAFEDNELASKYSIALSNLVNMGVEYEKEFYDFLSIIPEKWRYFIIFYEDQGKSLSSVFNVIVNSSEDRSLFLEKLFIRSFTVANVVMDPLLSAKCKEITSGEVAGLLHYFAKEDYSEFRLQNLSKFVDLGYDFSEFNYPDGNGDTPFEAYIDRLHGLNEFQGEFIENITENGYNTLPEMFKNMENLVFLGVGLRDYSKDNKKNISTIEKIIRLFQLIDTNRQNPDKDFISLYQKITEDYSDEQRLDLIKNVVFSTEIDDYFKQLITQIERDQVIYSMLDYHDLSDEDKEQVFKDLELFIECFPQELDVSLVRNILLLTDKEYDRNIQLLLNYYDSLHDILLLFNDQEQEQYQEALEEISGYYYRNNFRSLLLNFSSKILNESEVIEAFTDLEEALDRDKNIISETYIEQIVINIERIVEAVIREYENDNAIDVIERCLEIFIRTINNQDQSLIMQEISSESELEDGFFETEIEEPDFIKKKRSIEELEDGDTELVSSSSSAKPIGEAKKARVERVLEEEKERTLGV